VYKTGIFLAAQPQLLYHMEPAKRTTVFT
jgi:hypothetical protein